jgi:multidrug efflux system membrane fusion protein
MEGSSGYFCYVVRPDGTAERRSIELGPVQDGIAVIERGVAAGEKVVFDGQFRLSEGVRTQIIEPAAKSEPTKSGPKG